MTTCALVEQRTLSDLAWPEQQPHREEPQVFGWRGQNRLKSSVNPIDWHIGSLLQICRKGILPFADSCMDSIGVAQS